MTRRASWAGIARPVKTSSVHAKAAKSAMAGHAPRRAGQRRSSVGRGAPGERRAAASTHANAAAQGLMTAHTLPTSADR